jgi:hypothetical protein
MKGYNMDDIILFGNFTEMAGYQNELWLGMGCKP